MVVALPVCLTDYACAPASVHEQPAAPVKAAVPHGAGAAAEGPKPRLAALAGEPCSIPALVELWRERTGGPASDLPVGPGDVIDISVPEVDELQNQKVRVSAQGEIELPLIGTIEAAGLGENELHDALVHKLKKYMKNPRVQLFVENYRSRGVAVMGAVQKPGFYDLADENESLQSVIGLAGGLGSGAAEKVIFSPAQSRSSSANSRPANGFSFAAPAYQPVAVAQAGAPSAADVSPGAAASVAEDSLSEHSIVLNLFNGGDAGCLGLPARPGDVLIVPVAGQVMVEGWVQNPGGFAITPGMTILGAVSAAGGPVFSWWVELIRANPQGGKTITRYTLSKLESGQETDPPVQSGDVLLVEKTLLGAVPYSLYSLFGHFGTGIALPIF